MPVTLPKITLIAVSTQLQETIVSDEELDPSSKTKVSAVHYSGVQDQWSQTK